MNCASLLNRTLSSCCAASDGVPPDLIRLDRVELGTVGHFLSFPLPLRPHFHCLPPLPVSSWLVSTVGLWLYACHQRRLQSLSSSRYSTPPVASSSSSLRGEPLHSVPEEDPAALGSSSSSVASGTPHCSPLWPAAKQAEAAAPPLPGYHDTSAAPDDGYYSVLPPAGEPGAQSSLAPSAPLLETMGVTGDSASGVGVADSSCAVCMDKPKDTVLLDCGHRATCHDCALSLQNSGKPLCPICRSPIKKTIRVYDA